MDNQNGTVSPSDIEAIENKLSQIVNDPDTAFLHCHCLDVEALINHTEPRPREETCPSCPSYIKFALKHPKRIPHYSIDGARLYPNTLILIQSI
jgi:hypothetical protein